MEKIKQQFGVMTVDGQVRKYCNLAVEIGSCDKISKESLCEQFKLIAENFWIYMQGKTVVEPEKEKTAEDGSIDFDASFLGKGWMR